MNNRKEIVNGTALTLTNEFGSYSVTVNDDGLTMPVLIQRLVKPVLLAAGYHPNTVDKYFPEDME